MSLKKLMLLFICLNAFNQLSAGIDSEGKLSAKAERKLADNLFANGSYYTAYDYYKDVVRRNPKDRLAIYGAAKSLMYGRDYENAALWFKKLIDQKAPTNPKELNKWKLEKDLLFPLMEMEYALMLKQSGNYDEAKIWFEKAKSNYSKPDKDLIVKRCNVELAGIEFAKTSNQPIYFKLKKLDESVNKAYSELSPIALNDSQMIFSSIRKDKTVYYDNNSSRDLPLLQLYRAVYEGGEWTAIRPFHAEMTDKEKHVANGSFSEDGNRFYFTKCENEYDRVASKCQLYLSEKKANIWQKAVRLNEQINDVNFTCSQPSVRFGNNGRDIVYFSSNKPGGKGGMDIWYFVRLKDGNFRASQPLKAINTEFDEITPSYSNSDSTFYFATNGRPGYGGYDLFKSVESETAEWSEPVNLGLPFNSPADDQYLNKTPGINNGFITSNRIGTTPLQSKTCCDDIYRWDIFRLQLNGTILDNAKGSGQVLAGSVKRVFRVESDGSKTLVGEDSSSSAQFSFNLPSGYEYEVIASKPGYAPIQEIVSTKNMTEDDTTYKEFGIAKSSIFTKGFVYAETDAAKTPLTDVSATLFEVNTRTGNEKVVNKLTCSAESPNFPFEIEKNKKYRVVYKKNDYFTKSIFIEPNIKKTEEDITAFLTTLEIGRSYTLSNIYYEYNKAELSYASMLVLDTLVMLLNDNPSIVIELGAHTDSIGNDTYNQKLSQSRAESCTKYIISKGVKAERVKAKGYGESMPIAPNSMANGKDNPDGRQKNRRTEFKIVGKIGGMVKIKYADQRKDANDKLEIEKSGQ